MNVGFDFQYSGKDETAPRLPNSAGDSKKRLHLFGLKQNDRFGIAVDKQIKTDGKAPELNWFQKKFYVLVPDPKSNNTIWYKVNKNSLTKRFQINETELEKAEASPDVLMKLLQDKYQARAEWEKIEDNSVSNGRLGFSSWHTADSLPSRFIDALVNAGIKPGQHKIISFWSLNRFNYLFTSDGSSGFKVLDSKDDNRFNLRNFQKGTFLSVIYCEPHNKSKIEGINYREKLVGGPGFDPESVKKQADFINGPESPLVIIELNDANVKSIIKNGKFPEEVLRQLQS